MERSFSRKQLMANYNPYVKAYSHRLENQDNKFKRKHFTSVKVPGGFSPVPRRRGIDLEDKHLSRGDRTLTLRCRLSLPGAQILFLFWGLRGLLNVRISWKGYRVDCVPMAPRIPAEGKLISLLSLRQPQ